MARRGDGLVLKGKTWWLDFTFGGIRHQSRLGKGIRKMVARELAAVERSKILRGEAGIGGKKRKDITFEKAVEEFLKWSEANHRPRTTLNYVKNEDQNPPGATGECDRYMIPKEKYGKKRGRHYWSTAKCLAET